MTSLKMHLGNHCSWFPRTAWRLLERAHGLAQGLAGTVELMLVFPMSSCSAGFVPWHGVHADVQPMPDPLLGGLIISKVQAEARAAWPWSRERFVCPLVPEWGNGNGFFKSVQTHNPNDSRVIAVQLFWIKWAVMHQHEYLKHGEQSFVAYV